MLKSLDKKIPNSAATWKNWAFQFMHLRCGPQDAAYLEIHFWKYTFEIHFWKHTLEIHVKIHSAMYACHLYGKNKDIVNFAGVFEQLYNKLKSKCNFAGVK